jgi:hypothetical protein
LLVLCIAITCISQCKTTDGAVSDAISFNEHIRPILSDKCFKCHGPDEKKRDSGYRLDTPEGAFAALRDQSHNFGIVKFKPELSEVVKRISSKESEYMMPPPTENLSLTQSEIDIITKWIKQGAEYQQHWAFMPIKPSNLEIHKEDKWQTNEIDYFVKKKFKEKGLEPAKKEAKELLLRRLFQDIVGLPPSIAVQDKFLNDESPSAYEAVVDQLLSSQQYGEKMAVMWMDVARYADSHGYQDDGLRTMWPWRDWVIHAFNSNYSYEKFITYQLAGDLMPKANKEMILATGFNRNHKITQEGGVIDEEYRVEYVSDRTNTFSKGILAMTFECAKCHDHKYDPISQKDYYSTFAFFNQVDEKGLYGDISLASLADPPYMTISNDEKKGILKFINKLDTSNVRVMIMKDSSIKRPTYVLDRGVYDQHTTKVDCNTPKSILAFDTTKFDKNRYGLTQWLFDDDNPLTARVFVNRVWQDIFGRGIVKTSGDFGLQGELPSHPELLEYLAYDFRANGWDTKRLIRKIVMSSTYQQSSIVNTPSYQKDPENVYLSRGPRVKKGAEFLRDHILATSGLLDKSQIGGPSVKSYQPKGLWESASSGRGQLATYVQDHGASLYRRGLYQFIKRTVPPPNMLIFDGSNRDQCEVRRLSTNTPLQSLVMLNDVQILEASRYLAQSLVKMKKSSDEAINFAFRSIMCRKPKKEELTKLTEYYNQTLSGLTITKAKKILAVGEYTQPKEKLVETCALMQTFHILYNLEEITIK